MKLLKFPEEVKDLYLDQYHFINSYIESWVDTKLTLKHKQNEVHIFSNVLNSLCKLLNISPTEHTLGDVKIDFNDTHAAINFDMQLERLIINPDPKIKLMFTFLPFWSKHFNVVPKRISNKAKSYSSSLKSQSYYFAVSTRDLHLTNKLNVPSMIISPESLVREIITRWSGQWSYDELFSTIDILSIIHTSLLELKDNKSLLDFSMIDDIPNHSSIYLEWFFYMLPDLVVYFFNINSRSNLSNQNVKSSITDSFVYLPLFTMKLNIIRN